MIKRFFYILIMANLFLSCEHDTYADLEEEVVFEEVITYNSHVKNIIDQNCISCHSDGQTASFRPLTNFNQVRDAVLNADLINRIQRQNGEPGQMPQTGRMSQNQIETILQWVEGGFLEF